jgi:replication factor A1
MQTHEIEPHLDELTRALGNKVGSSVQKEELEDELKKYLEYGVPPQEAIRTILRHHGAEAPAATAAGTTGRQPLADIPANTPNVDLLVRLHTMNTRTVVARGEEKEIFWGLIGDETASVPYTSWRPLEGLAKGDVIEVKGAYTKEFRGELQVNFGDRTQIAKRDNDELPTQPAEFREVNVGDLKEGLRGFKITGRFLSVSTKEVQVQGEPKTLWTGFFADDSGKVEFTCWEDLNLQEDAVVTIEGGYVRAFRGVPQFNFDKSATITPFEGNFAPAEELDVVHTWTVKQLTDKGDVGNATIRATLLEVRPGSGLVFRDTETKRVVPGGGEGSEPDLRIKFILDDGTDCVQCVVGRTETERILGKTLEQCLGEAKAAFPNGDEILTRLLADKLNGRVFLADGFARKDDYGVMFIARSLTESTEDTADEAGEILDAMGAQ